jgi:peptidoglycan/LPS O-acetylase OafA/YrhL
VHHGGVSASIPPRQQFIALNGLRGVAALVVVQRHAHDFLGFGVLPGGYLAVDFFFLLSGWVLAHAYDRRLETTMSGLDFMRARLLRLYPVYLLGLLLALAQALFAGDPTALGWFALSLLFLPDLWIRNFFWMIPATWSLAAELLINLPFGFGHRRLTTPILLAAVGLGAVALIATSLTYGTLDAGSMGSNWPGGLARVLFAFPLGVLLYRHRTALAGWAPRWATLPSMALLVALFSIPAWDAALQLLDLATVMIALPAVLLFASRTEPGPTLAGLATALGNMSYPIYVCCTRLTSGWRRSPAWLFSAFRSAPPPRRPLRC